MSEESQCCGCKKTTSIFFKYVILRSLRLALYSLDIASDVAVAYADYTQGRLTFAYVTLGLVFAPGILLAFYMICDSLWTYRGELSSLKSIFWLLIGPFIPVWPILRDIRLIAMGFVATVSKRKRPIIVKYLDSPSKAYLLKFLEAFTEAAPQLIVRLLKLCSGSPLQFTNLNSSEITQLCFSFTTLSITIVSTHQKSISTDQVIQGELEQPPKYRLTCLSQIFAIVWWLCFLLARLQALTLFAASFHYWILAVVGIHVIVLFLLQTIASHKENLQKIFIYLFSAFVFVFAYVQYNTKSKVKVAAWISYSLFTAIVFLENTTMLTCWLFDQHSKVNNGLIGGASFNHSSTNSTTPLYHDITEMQLKSHWQMLLFVHYGLFAISVVFMVLTFISSPYPTQQQEASAVELQRFDLSQQTTEQ